MAIPKEYSEKVTAVRGLRANKDYTRFFYRFKIEGREFTTTIDYTKKQWNKTDRKKYAIAAAIKFKEDKSTEMLNPFNPDTKMDFISDAYFSKKCSNSKWNLERKRIYELHIQPLIGQKKVSRVIEYDIDKIRTEMESVSHPKYSSEKVGVIAKSFSHRTIRKVLLQVLKPILVYAQSNGAIGRLPTINAPTGGSSKKIVKDGTHSLSVLHQAIMNRYTDQPFYRALFLFALYGRRWNEIRTLRWEDTGLDSHEYTIAGEHNKAKIDQTYKLPYLIEDALLLIKGDRTGLVFKSPVTGRELSSPKKQLAKLIEDTGIEHLTMHYFRHILVTAAGEVGTEATIMSAALGHTDSRTLDKHYRTINHTKASVKANAQLESIIEAEVVG